MADVGYFDIPFTTGQASPPPSLSLFPNNPMLGAVASLIGRAIGGTDSEGNPFFKLPSFQPDTRTTLERTLYGNNEVVQKYLASMNRSLGIENLGNILQHTPLSGFAGNQTFSEFAMPFVNEFLMKSQDQTFGAMQSGIYGAHNQMFPGTGIGSNTPQGDAAALAGIYKSMYKNTWGDHNINNTAFTYGLTEQQMAPLVQRAVASGAYREQIDKVRSAGQEEYKQNQAYKKALRDAFSGHEDQLKVYNEGISTREAGRKFSDEYTAQSNSIRSAIEEREKALEAESGTRYIWEGDAELRERYGGNYDAYVSETNTKLQNFRSFRESIESASEGRRTQADIIAENTKKLNDLRSNRENDVRTAGAKVDAAQKKLDETQKALDGLNGVEGEDAAATRKQLEDIKTKQQADLEAAHKEQNEANKASGASLVEQNRLTGVIKEATEKYQQLTKDINTQVTEFQNGAGGEDEETKQAMREYAENTKKLIDAQDKLAQAQKLEAEGQNKISEAVEKAGIDKDTEARINDTKAKADEAKKATESATSDLNSKMQENQKNLNRTISAMTSAYGSAELATQAFDLEYGPQGYRDANLQKGALDNAYRLHAAASEAGIDVRKLTQTRMMTMNAAGARMGFTQEELKAGWGAEDSGRFGQAAAEATVIGGYDPITGKFDSRRYEKLAPGYRERYAEIANSQQEKLQTIIQYMNQTGQISDDQLEEYRTMLEQGDTESRRAGIRDMATQVFGSYDAFMRVYNNNNRIQMMRDDLTQESRDAKAASLERQRLNQDSADINNREAINKERRASADLIASGKSFAEVETIKNKGEFESYKSALDEIGGKGAESFKEAIASREKQLREQYQDDPGRVTKELNSYVRKYARDLLSNDDADKLIQVGRIGRANAAEAAATADDVTQGTMLRKQLSVVEQRNAYGELTDDEKRLYNRAEDLLKSGNAQEAQDVFNKFTSSLEKRGHKGLVAALKKTEKFGKTNKSEEAEELDAAADVANARGYGASGTSALLDSYRKNSEKSKGIVPDKEGKKHTDKTAAEQIQENIEKAKATIGTKVEEKAQSGPTGVGEVIQGVVEGRLYNPILNGGASPEELKNSPIMQAIEELKRLLTDISNNTFGTYDSLRLGGGGI